MLRRFASLAAALLALALSSPAGADAEADLIRARRLYSQGLTQEAAGDWAGALATFEDVARIKANPQVRFHVARCKEHLGRLNEALGGYRMAEYEAEQTGKEPKLVDEVKKAREALEGRIPRLTIARGKGAEAIKIELDGVALGDTQIGQPITLDPGPHVLTGVVEQGKAFKRTLTLAERDSVRIELDVPEDLVTPAAPPTAERPAPAPPPRASTPPREQTAPRVHSSSAAPWIVGGLGLASLATSAVFYSLRVKAEDELDQGCIGRTCPDTLKGTQANGEAYAALSGVTLGLGIVGVGAGALMLLGQKSPPENPPAAALELNGRGGRVSLSGRF